MSQEPVRQVQLRRDLEFSSQQQQGKSYLVVKDPVTRRYFRFTEAQASIMEFFKDAPEDIATIAIRASEKLNAAIAVPTIEAFCKSLEEKFLLETPEVREKLGAIQGQQLEGRNFLYWKIASVNPERIFAWLLPRTKWAFRPAFQFFALTAICTGFLITYLNWQSLSGAAPALFSIYGLLLIWPVVFTVTTIHEFSHGLTCCHYGGKVHEVGFMLIYFSPAFYCDVSDSYMFPKRTHRMAVALAGGFAQLTVWGVCTVLWRLTDSDAFVNQLALIVVVFSGLQTLLNFNPLIKLDGYYMLSDFLEVPNLRAKALRSFWDWIAGNGKSAWSYREKRAQLVYGAASAVFSISLLVYVYTALYTWATSKYELAGLVVFGIFANFTLRKALVEPMEGVKAVAARASLKRYRNIGIALVALILSIFMNWDLTVSAPFEIVPLKDKESIARADTAGFVVDLRVHENSVVHKGEILARLADNDKDERLQDISGQLQSARNKLDILLNGTRPEEISDYEALIASKNINLEIVHRNQERRGQLEAQLAMRTTEREKAHTKLTRDQKLFDQGLLAPRDYDDSVSNAKVADGAVQAAAAEIRALEEKADNDARQMSGEVATNETHLRTLKAGSRPDEIVQAKSEVKRLAAILETLTSEMKKSDIVAKIDGTVTSADVKRRFGQRLELSDELLRLVDMSVVSAEMTVSQKDLEDLKSWKKVRLQLDSYPSLKFEGKVDFIATVAQTVNGQQMVTVRTDLENKDGILKPGLTGTARIYCGERRVIEVLTHNIIRWLERESWRLRP